MGGAPKRRLRFPMRRYTEDRARAADSSRKLARLAPQTICFGHGPALRDAAPIIEEFAASL